MIGAVPEDDKHRRGLCLEHSPFLCSEPRALARAIFPVSITVRPPKNRHMKTIHVLVDNADCKTSTSIGSIPGATWANSLAAAFLVVHMRRQPLATQRIWRIVASEVKTT